MAYHGIAACYGRRDQWFGGVTCTNGAGSSRRGLYASYTDEEMVAVRRDEQRKAAVLGEFSMVAQLDFPSAEIKDPTSDALAGELLEILRRTRPHTIYTHNPCDKHASHIAVFANLLRALRQLAPEERPERVYGCEVWRNLDWMPDELKVVLDVSARENLASALVGVFDSQISGGKRYDLAALGRWRANATFFNSHAGDQAEMATYAMDLMPLVVDPELDPVQFALGLVDRFRGEVETALRRQLKT